jgi:ATP-dependent Zn protease
MYKVDNKTENDNNQENQENKVKMMKQMLQQKMQEKMMQQKMQPPARENFSLPKSKHKGMYIFIVLLIIAFVVGLFMWKRHSEKSGKAGFKFY